MLDSSGETFTVKGFEERCVVPATSGLRHAKEWLMLVLSRKKDQSIVINNDITIVVVEIRGDKVRLGVEAPKEVPVHRREVYEAIARGDAADVPSVSSATAGDDAGNTATPEGGSGAG